MIKSAYIAIDPEIRHVAGACRVDSNDNDGIAEFIKQGLVLDRVTLDQARDMCFKKLPDDWKV
jgi:hypothetical protein